MQRIFIGLAIAATALLLANVYLGLTAGDFNSAAHAFYDQGELLKDLKNEEVEAKSIATAKHEELRAKAKELRAPMTRHMLLGILATLISLLACSVSITYFVGTSRWFKEVVDTYKLDQAYVVQSQRVKRLSFRWSVLGALGILVVVGLGAAAEPSWGNAQYSQSYVQPHYLASLAAIGFLSLSFYMQWSSLAENGKLIDQVMSEVRRIRRERGLAVEAEPTHS